MKMSWHTLKPPWLLLIGGIISFVSAKSLYQANETKGWPTTAGIIIDADVADGEIVGSDNVVRIHVPHVSYQYEVEGKTYKSDRLSYYDTYRVSKRRSRNITNRYQVGRSIPVYYSAVDPSVSVLKPGISGSGNLEPAARVIVFAFGALGLMLGLHEWVTRMLANNERTAGHQASNNPIEPTC